MTAIIAAGRPQEGWNSYAYAFHFSTIANVALNAESPRLRAFWEMTSRAVRGDGDGGDPLDRHD